MPSATLKALPQAEQPWQLAMFDVSLKKRQKLALLKELLGPLEAERCLLVTHGDNPGSLNYHLRAAGGFWTWAELEAEGVGVMEELLGERVHVAAPSALPFSDGEFDRVVVVDAHEHMEEVAALNQEIARVLAADGVAIITTPGGNPRLPVAVLKRWLGMDNARYGHVVQGYRVEELAAMLSEAGLEPMGDGAYSRFFTELAELAINFGYVRILGPLKRRQRAGGVIAPRTAADLADVRRTYRIYRLIYPFVRAFSALDVFVPGRGGYAVAVAACKPAHS
jgi:SAM-dependent methyltransferase